MPTRRILTLALEHQLVTRLTSLVAVDKTPAGPEGETLKLDRAAAQPAGRLGLRKGVRRASAARLGARRTPRGRRAARSTQLAMAKRSPIPTAAPRTVSLPKTATDAELKMIAGAVLLALGLILLVFTRRREFAR